MTKIKIGQVWEGIHGESIIYGEVVLIENNSVYLKFLDETAYIANEYFQEFDGSVGFSSDHIINTWEYIPDYKCRNTKLYKAMHK